MHVSRHLCSTVSTDMLVWLNLTTFSYISLKGILSTGICLFDIIMCNNLNVLFLQTVLCPAVLSAWSTLAPYSDVFQTNLNYGDKATKFANKINF